MTDTLGHDPRSTAAAALLRLTAPRVTGSQPAMVRFGRVLPAVHGAQPDVEGRPGGR